MMSLKIKKRSGGDESFNPQKIYNRIKKAAKGLNVNSDEIFIKVITSVPTEGLITTKELDKLIYEISASYTGSHHDYSRLASSIAISTYHKETDESFSNTMHTLHVDGVINDKLMEIIESYGPSNIDDVIVHENDNNFDYFAWRSLQEMYLLKTPEGKVIERPQHMYMRVALWVTKSFEDAVAYYKSLSNQLISPATPIMINSGTKIPQLASCVLHYNDSDSRHGLLNTIRDISTYSADAAGIGLSMSNIRSKESRINSSGGYAGGLLKYLKIVNESLRFFNQQGRRPGSAAIYIEPWHKDIMDLLEIKKNSGAEEMRARDLFTALWIPDNFMRAVKSNGDWYLFCPNDIIKSGIKPLQECFGDEYEENYNKAVKLGIGKKIKAQEIWSKVIESQVETGVPYLSAKDSTNKKTNHQNIGVIKQSNLCCLTGDAILNVERENGDIENISIKDVIELIECSEKLKVKSKDGLFVDILTGKLTRKKSEIMEIIDEETGFSVKCTSDHLIFTKNRGYVRADELNENDELEMNIKDINLNT
jgi:ribonucleoside-diphosphate reductase alpha chain